MRSSNRLVFTLALTAFVAAGCREGTGVRQDDSVPHELLIKLAAARFDTAGVYKRGADLVVEGDLRIPIETIRAWGRTPKSEPAGPRLQWRSAELVSQAKVATSLKVDLTGLSAAPDWQSAARAAITEWNAIGGTKVNFAEGTPADIVLRYSDLGYCTTAALAGLPPGNGNPYGEVTVNSGYLINCGQYSGALNNASTKKRNIVHELGHTIGFRHTNWQSRGEPTAIQIAGTPTTDAASVMNGGTADVQWAGFSGNDKVAVRALYPFTVNATGPLYIAQGYYIGSNHCTFAYSGGDGTAPFSVQWTLTYIPPSGGSPSGMFGPSTASTNSITTTPYVYGTISTQATFQAIVRVTDALGRTGSLALSGPIYNMMIGQEPYCS